MTRRKKVWIALGVVVVLAGVGYANFGLRGPAGTAVTVEKVSRQDLEAVVSASGKIQAKKTVNISAETMGKVVDLQVAEGDTVKAGQPLLQIDPRNLETAVQNREASLATARSQLEQTRSQAENSKVALRQAEDTLRRQESLMKEGLIPRETYERTLNDFRMRQTDVRVSEQSVRTQEQRIKQEEASLESARYDLNKVRIVSPIDGIVIRRNIEEGETAIVGTMNNAGTVLLTIADLSVLETEIEVDETDIPFIRTGQTATITIDAIPNREFTGRVTELGNSPIQATGQAAQNAGRATNFKVVVTIDGEVPNVRPGFTCTAVITTATRSQALAVPIQAMTVRELTVNAAGKIVTPPAQPTPAAAAGETARPAVSAPLGPGQTRKEFEGVFVARLGRAVFVPVKVGIAGERYFEVLEGLKEEDEVIIGPFASVRSLREGDAIRVTDSSGGLDRGRGTGPPAETRQETRER
jgi:HlyD family secretion protein